MKSNLLPIAREGWSFLYVSAALFLLFALLDFENLEFIAFLATAFFVYVFRNPERESVAYEQESVVSPVDGIVVSIEELSQMNEYKVEIDSTYFNVSLLRAPFTASLQRININHGARLQLNSPLAKDINENAEIVFSNKSGYTIRIIHMLKQSFKSIEIDAYEGKNILQGVRYGFMLNGITTIYVSRNFRLNIDVGNELRASETLIGYFTAEKKS